jgi:hypothetical protein
LVAFEMVEHALERLDGIQTHEVHSALASPRRWPRAAHEAHVGIRVLTIWARTAEGRPLVIATRKHSEWTWQCFGARDMKPEELLEFEAWEAGERAPAVPAVPA